MKKMIAALLLGQLALTPLAHASGGSVWKNGIGFVIIGIDDGTWDTIQVCQSDDDVGDYPKAHCLNLKKGKPAGNGFISYSNGTCHLMGKRVDENFATYEKDSLDQTLLSEGFYVIKVPPNEMHCSLAHQFAGGNTVVRSVTGIYRAGG